jgi:hypothetical protein
MVNVVATIPTIFFVSTCWYPDAEIESNSQTVSFHRLISGVDAQLLYQEQFPARCACWYWL